MPHSSGGGSHGGGSHGGSHGSSGPRISSHYFAGSRRYRRHHISTGRDDYIYASSKPQRASLSSIVFLGVMLAVFLSAFGFGVQSQIPHKLKGHYLDMPAIHDDVDLFANDEKLQDAIDEYYETTGICTVFYTVYDEMWEDDYDDLESYAFDKYVRNFSDEEHWVFVYSIPVRDVVTSPDARPDRIPDYKWEAIQGDNTDPIITESMFKRFADKVQDSLENGDDPADAFSDAFAYASDKAASMLTPGNSYRIFHSMTSYIPVLFVAGIFVPMLIMSIKKYKQDKDVEYEEVPFDTSDNVQGTAPGGIPVGGFTQTSSGYSRSYSLTDSKQIKAVQIVGMVVIIPFILVGIGILIGGISKIAQNHVEGSFMLVFGAAWLLISGLTLVKMIIAVVKTGKTKDSDPLTAEYPKAEYPKAEYPDMNPNVNPNVNPQTVNQPFAPSNNQTEFDPQFFSKSQSNVEDDEEEYRRMKRKGFE